MSRSKIWIEKLKKSDACREGVAWASEQESAQAAWDACERGDWMLWAWGRNCGKQGSKIHRRLVLCAVECARTSLKYIEDKEVKKLVKKSLKATERWARGEEGVTLEDVRNAAWHTAACAAWAWAATDAAAYWSAADAAHYAACAASDASDTDAARAAHYAAAAAHYAAATTIEKKLKKCAGIIRKLQPECPKFRRVTG